VKGGAVCAVAFIAALVPWWARAQGSLDAGTNAEIRVDAIAANGGAVVQAGGGVQIPAGYYARVGLIGAVGADAVASSAAVSGRLDIIGRFLLDPFREHAWGLSAGAGISLRAARRDKVRPYLAAVIDLEGPRRPSGMAPAFQVGLGGGVRVGAALRWGGRTTR